MIRNRVDVEAHRAGDMACEIFSRGVALHGRQIEGAVNDGDLGRAETLGQPIGAYEPR
jgi:hypothetical protein